MELKKKLVIEAETTDGKKMVAGNTYVMAAGGRSLCGVFHGINERKGSLSFDVVIEDMEIRFNIMPGSIERIYEADIKLNIDRVKEFCNQ